MAYIDVESFYRMAIRRGLPEGLKMLSDNGKKTFTTTDNKYSLIGTNGIRFG